MNNVGLKTTNRTNTPKTTPKNTKDKYGIANNADPRIEPIVQILKKDPEKPLELKREVSQKKMEDFFDLFKSTFPEVLETFDIGNVDSYQTNMFKKEIEQSLKKDNLRESQVMLQSQIKKGNKNYDKLVSQITSLQEKIGRILGDLKAVVVPKETKSNELIIEKHYKEIFGRFKEASNEFIKMRTTFDVYFSKLEKKILTDEKMTFDIPESQIQTIAYVLKAFDSLEIQQAINFSKEKYEKHYVKLRELVLKRLTIESNLHSGIQEIYLKSVAIGKAPFPDFEAIQDKTIKLESLNKFIIMKDNITPFTANLESALKTLRDNAISLSSINVRSLQDFVVNHCFCKGSEEIKAFADKVRAARLTFNDLSAKFAPAKLSEIVMHFREIKVAYMDFINKSDPLYPLIIKIQEKLKNEVETWETDPSIPDYQLQRLTIVSSIPEDALKKTYNDFLKKHKTNQQDLFILNKEINNFSDSFRLAQKEVNRVYDCLQSYGSFKYETVYDLNGWVDPDITIPFLTSAQAQPQNATTTDAASLNQNS